MDSDIKATDNGDGNAYGNEMETAAHQSSIVLITASLKLFLNFMRMLKELQ